jgi:Domain of unknown function (DUF1707)
MDDRLKTSDADRDRVTALLRDHFAAGRLTRQELDERLTATLNATTFGDLRRVLADLPEPGPALRQARQFPPRVAPPWIPARRAPRGPRLLPLAVLALTAALLIPGVGWFFLALFQAVLLLGLMAGLAGVVAAALFFRHVRRGWPPGYRHDRRQGWPGGYAHHTYGHWHS